MRPRRDTHPVRAGSGTVPAVLAVLAVLAVSAVAAPASAAAPGPVELRLPDVLRDPPPLVESGVRVDRLLRSVAPSTVANAEAVAIEVGGDGSPTTVTMTQRLEVAGTGDYSVRERGPARGVRALEDTVPPVLNLGTVVWQGFAPPSGRRLAARLVLDAGLEAVRLPLTVAVSFRPADGGSETPLGPGGALPGAGVVRVVLSNQSGSPREVPTGTAAAPAVAAALDRLRAAAAATAPGSQLPTAGNGIPATLPVTEPGRRTAAVFVPLWVVGTLRLTGAPGATVTGPGTTPAGAGASSVAGVLEGADAVFELTAPAPGGTLAMDLTATTALDPRTLRPPGGVVSWAAWTATGPSAAARRAATDTLVSAAAATARAAAYSPYLGANLTGPVTTTFRWTVAASEAVVAAAPRPRARPYAIGLAVLALLGVLGNAAALWRIA